MRQLQLPLFEDLRRQCEQLRKENLALKAEVSRLQGLLNQSSEPPTQQSLIVRARSGNEAHSFREDRQSAQPATEASDTDERIQLFRSLFRGREDVYALRWEGKGKSGYAPARKHQWDEHSTDPKTKRKICGPNCKTLALTDSVIRSHLENDTVVGVYPMLPDETCWFLAVDFDKASWMDDSSAFMEACEMLGVPAALERSRSGNGAHVWIFFDRPIPAYQARKVGAVLLTKCRNQRYQLSFDSYDRMFPNQDTMPKGQFGNLIALPLQSAAVQQENAVFLDQQFSMINDQWEFLRSVQRIDSQHVEKIIKTATSSGTVIPVAPSLTDEDGDEDGDEDPWTHTSAHERKDMPLAPPLPPQAQITLSNLVYLEKEGFSASALSRILTLAAFQNSDFYKYQAMRMSTFGRPRIISSGADFPKHIGLPRGCLDQLESVLRNNGVDFAVDDRRIYGNPLDVSFNGTLRPLQQQAAGELLSHDIGVLSATTAFGKTVVAAYCIAERKVNTLVLVHRAQLIDQWKERLASFLSLPPTSIGQIGGGKDKRTGLVDVATIQSLQRNGTVKDLVADYGHIIVDECHHIPAFTFEKVLKHTKARYVLGLTATPVRKDGHHPIIIMQCGPIRFKVGARDNHANNIKDHIVIPRQTTFTSADEKLSIQDLYSLLAADRARNDLIFDDILLALESGRSPLVITERTEHLEDLSTRLRGFAKNIIVFRGGLGKKQRIALRAQLDAVPSGEERIVLSTGRYIGEGFDDSRLDALFLAMPISWRGTLQQYAGRLHRAHEGKSEVRVYDYVDGLVPVLAKMYERRLSGYKSIGYRIDERTS